MPYTPDATVVGEPTDGEKASTAALEFRTLKVFIQDHLLHLTGGDLTGAILVDSTNAGFVSRQHDDNSYAGFRTFNSSNSRFLDILTIGATAGAAYGAVAGDTVFNVLSGKLVLSTNDTAALSFAHADQVATFSAAVHAPSLVGPLTGDVSGTSDHITNAGYNGYGVKTISNALPSGGADGDIWYQTT